jgi:hypothetical protein
MRKRVSHLAIASSIVILLLVATGSTLLLGRTSSLHAASAAAQGEGASQGPISLQAMHALFFVWASGTPAVQHLAAQDCAQVKLSAAQCQRVSDAVRAAWLDLASRDPAGVGRPDVLANMAGRAQALSALNNQLAAITSGAVSSLVSTTRTTYAHISQPQWIHDQAASAQTLPVGTALVWATSYSQSSLPKGLNPRQSAYAALPDAYIKFANWGTLSNIPGIYQPYYTPAGTRTTWTVSVATASGSRSVSNILITDVGPWNEDDNWWDPNDTSSTLPASCPVSTTLVAADATSNPLANGICPSGSAAGNYRRIYYYLLYQHFGLPFFQPSGYAPTGSFADGSLGSWPTSLAQGCSEAAAASTNSDGITCYGGTAPYNNANGDWLRNNTYDAGVTNQSSSDLSPAVNKALGWTYPSSGLVQVTVSGLP